MKETASAGSVDNELVRRFVDGDRSAFEELVVRHQNRVYGFCLRLLGSPSLAEEAAQEVLVKVFKYLPRFRGESKFTTWLYRVTLNHCRNVQAYRARRHDKRHDSLDAETTDDEGSTRRRELADDRPDAEEDLLLAERLRMMKEELAKLDPIWKEILLLRDVEGQSYEEIGNALDLPPGTVKSRIHRARGELKTRLKRRIKT
ncbi:MAG: sigma-70 family RNA polymerase sigma factor [Proteobacteria bacterium]|nr:sigma-70 family RNA polymerase sigma factor [Pseudomonadota bacterium]